MPTEAAEPQTAAYDVAALRMPTWRELALKMKSFAQEKSEWAGIPVPLPDLPMRLEPRFPYQMGGNIYKKPEEDMVTVINSWYSRRRRGQAFIVETADGKRHPYMKPNGHMDKLLGTMMASVVWPLEAEQKAILKLAEMVRNNMFLSYLLTGQFLETSKRSGLTYMFRKLRPTVVMSPKGGEMTILCALCLHPIGYYEGTWAGCMTPTDEVVAHLCMMRGDEPKYWAAANQHPPDRPEAGI